MLLMRERRALRAHRRKEYRWTLGRILRRVFLGTMFWRPWHWARSVVYASKERGIFKDLRVALSGRQAVVRRKGLFIGGIPYEEYKRKGGRAN
jgi:hypothetical protein